MWAIIIRSPVIMRRPICPVSSSRGIDSQRCSVALRSMSALPFRGGATIGAGGPRGQCPFLGPLSGDGGPPSLLAVRYGGAMPRKPGAASDVEFSRLAARLSQDPRVDPPEIARAKGFGSKGLKVARKLFAFGSKG